MNIVNGGPGSGNFNPGQGRVVGKPSNGHKNSYIVSLKMNGFSREKAGDNPITIYEYEVV